MKKPVIIFLLIMAGSTGFVTSWYFHPHLDGLPVLPPPPRSVLADSDVQFIRTYHSPVSFVRQLAGDADAGRKIYIEFCASCHAAQPLIETGAPRVDDKKAWRLREAMGMDALLNVTANGIGAMPARGGCFECSDAQLREAINYLLRLSCGPRSP